MGLGVTVHRRQLQEVPARDDLQAPEGRGRPADCAGAVLQRVEEVGGEHRDLVNDEDVRRPPHPLPPGLAGAAGPFLPPLGHLQHLVPGADAGADAGEGVNGAAVDVRGGNAGDGSHCDLQSLHAQLLHNAFQKKRFTSPCTSCEEHVAAVQRVPQHLALLCREVVAQRIRLVRPGVGAEVKLLTAVLIVVRVAGPTGARHLVL
mmetsp:Transcript_48492/g.78932  ORF Transcript_48492/g.78932 Transcript_48492/m.78932 type:complete len:204 (+) Transcript_48492:2006-2617(+)